MNQRQAKANGDRREPSGRRPATQVTIGTPAKQCGYKDASSGHQLYADFTDSTLIITESLGLQRRHLHGWLDDELQERPAGSVLMTALPGDVLWPPHTDGDLRLLA